MTGMPDLMGDSRDGSPSVSEPAFLDLVYDELHRLASSLLRHERPAHTLQTSALVNEAFLRLNTTRTLRFEDRRHFLRLAARAMRQVLTDYARHHNAQKREGELIDLDAVQHEVITGEKV